MREAPVTTDSPQPAAPVNTPREGGSTRRAGDGWSAGPGESRVWGRFGAAGALLFTVENPPQSSGQDATAAQAQQDADTSFSSISLEGAEADAVSLVPSATVYVLLQHRAPWTASGGTWALPGGAIDVHETAVDAALRETEEETGIPAQAVTYCEDLRTAGPFPADSSRPELAGGWTYTVVIGHVCERLPVVWDQESEEVCWVPLDQVDNYNLMPAFRKSWPRLKPLVAAHAAGIVSTQSR